MSVVVRISFIGSGPVRGSGMKLPRGRHCGKARRPPAPLAAVGWAPTRYARCRRQHQRPTAGGHVSDKGMLEAIGNTPLVRLRNIVPEGAATVLVKLEYGNPTGSYKDRMALSMIERAERRGTLKPGMTVVEYTGGSTGIALAFVCAVKGYRCRIVTNDAVALEKRRSMEIFGAELEVLKSQGGKLTADLVPRMMERAREIASETPSYATDQMRNPDMVAGYESLGEELLRQVIGPIHTFCAAVGTAGTHGVEGVAPGFVPPQFDRGIVSEARGISEAEGRRMAWELARREGIFAGTSTGLNVVGALQIAKEIGAGHTVVTVAVDSGFKYLAGDLYALKP